MNVSAPHYLLFSEASSQDGPGRWRFELRSADGSQRFKASDTEPDVRGERLALLTVVRALENLDQPSQVTLVGCSPYVRQGMQYGLPEWRDNGWRWESFGQMVPVRNSDLWQRMDRALRFHHVDCRGRQCNGAIGPVLDRRAAEDVEDSGEMDRRVETRVATALGFGYLVVLVRDCFLRRTNRVFAFGMEYARRCVCELRLLWRTWGNWLKEDTKTRSSCSDHIG